MSGPEGAAAPLHAQAARGRGFGEDAERYDRARPGYPDAVAADLGARPGLRVLDVGCGTGKSAQMFLARGCTVLGLEPDARMAAVATARGLDVEIAGLEEWDDAGRRFALVVAGQAWHWLDPERAAARAATLLEPGGHLAPFWNFRRPLPTAAATALEECYARHAPEVLDGRVRNVAGAAGETGIAAHVAAIAAHPGFGAPDTRHYRWSQAYDAAGWRALLSTQSDLRALAADARAALLDAVEDALGALGGLVVDYETVVVDARRVGN